MQRSAFLMQLKKNCEEEYKRRHDDIWDELKQLLSASGVYDYSIYHDESTGKLFAFQKTKDGKGAETLGENPIVQKWWDYMADIMEVNSDNSPVCIPLKEVFHMD
ncbi:MAG: L-rhamnose mutarotase [Spirochaetia bacterium]|nr:L-rhamnose mutarotase [Spirochaetia bacterium]MCF7945851.1 L-rhamnose mutarotase [Spirochaetia bacterium]